MAPSWTTVNTTGLRSAGLSTPASSTTTVPKCKVDKPKKQQRKSSTIATENIEKMREQVVELEREIALNAGMVKLPTGITNEHSVIKNILDNGVPGAHSVVGTKWTRAEHEFVAATITWKHDRLAAYLGRTCQATRLERCKVTHGVTRNRDGKRSKPASTLRSPTTGSSGSDITSDADNSSVSDLDSGVDISFDSTNVGEAAGSYERSVTLLPEGGVKATPLLPSLTEWDVQRPFDKNFFGKYHPTSKDQRRVERMEEVFNSLPEGKVVPWRLTSSYEQGLTAQQKQDQWKGSALHVLADVAGTVDSRGSAVSRPAPPTRPGQGEYQDPLTVMGVI